MKCCVTAAPLGGRSTSRIGVDQFYSLDQVFKDIWRGAPQAATSLRLDVREDEKAFHVTADLPGLNDKEVDVSYQDDALTIRGEKKIDRDEKKDSWHMTERSYGSFARTLAFPANIETDQIVAKFDRGVLSITLPKLAETEAKTKKIEVTVG